jgi:two-component system response regulator
MTSQPILLAGDNPDHEALTFLNTHRSGANAYVRKPVKFADLADTVRAPGVFWLRLNEPAPSRVPGLDEVVRP